MASDAATFFEQVLPKLATAARDRLERLEGHVKPGAIAFEIDGSGWTFTFGASEPVSTGLSPDADLILRFTGSAFRSYVSGWLDIVDAVAKGELKIEGDLILERQFSRLVLVH